MWDSALKGCKRVTNQCLSVDDVRNLLRSGFSENMIQDMHRVLMHKDIRVFENVQKTIKTVKDHARKISPEIELGMKFLDEVTEMILAASSTGMSKISNV